MRTRVPAGMLKPVASRNGLADMVTREPGSFKESQR
jgi:hypothetical protein